jgi:hypothetical protein
VAAPSPVRAVRRSRTRSQPWRPPQAIVPVLALVGLVAEHAGRVGVSSWSRLLLAGQVVFGHARRLAAPAVAFWAGQLVLLLVSLGLLAAAGLATVNAALGPQVGASVWLAALPPLLAMLAVMCAVLLALYDLANGNRGPRSAWLLVPAAILLLIS